MAKDRYYLGIVYDQKEIARSELSPERNAVTLEINEQIVRQLDIVRLVLEVDALTDYCFTHSTLDKGFVIQLRSAVSYKQLRALIHEAGMNSALTIARDPYNAIPRTRKEIGFASTVKKLLS